MNAPINYQGNLFKGSITTEIKKALRDTEKYSVQLLKSKTPVDTGKLKASWVVQAQGKGLLFQNSAPYAAYVELGTKKMTGRNMLGSSLTAIELYYTQALARHIGTKLSAPLKVQLENNLTYSTVSASKPNYANRLRKLLNKT